MVAPSGMIRSVGPGNLSWLRWPAKQFGRPCRFGGHPFVVIPYGDSAARRRHDRSRTVKYMLLFMHPGMNNPAEAVDGCEYEDWVRYDKEMKDAGIWVSGYPLQDETTATTVRVGPTGERTVTDGPFAETREVLGGFDIIDVPNLDVALDWAARSPGSLGSGWVHVRPIADFEA
jgi:hypothetical protein